MNINTILNLGIKYGDDLTRICKNRAFTSNPINIGGLRDLKIATTLVDTVELGKTCTFLKELGENYKQIGIKLKIGNSLDDFIKYEGSSMGSNPAYWARNKKTGELFYVKYADDISRQGHIESEYLASKLYNLAGIKTPQIEKGVTEFGESCILSKYEPNLRDLKISEAQECFGADAWLANWDSLIDGNTFSKGGKAIKIDNGGALKYRAQGGLKENFGYKVDELVTLVSGKNPTSKYFYEGLSEERLFESIKKVTDIPDNAIKELVKDEELVNILLNRKKYLQLVLRVSKKRACLDESIPQYIKTITNIANKNFVPIGEFDPKELRIALIKILKKDFNLKNGFIKGVPCTDSVVNSLVKGLKEMQAEGVKISQDDIIKFFERYSQRPLNMVKNVNQTDEANENLYRILFTNLKNLAEKNPIKDGEEVYTYVKRLNSLRKKNIRQMNAGRLRFVKSRLEYVAEATTPQKHSLTPAQRKKAIEQLEEQRIYDAKYEDVYLIPELKPDATDEEIFEAWLSGHLGHFEFKDRELERSVISLGKRYNSSAKQTRISRYEVVTNNDYKQEFKYEPLYRWMCISDVEKFADSLPRRGEIYTLPSKQSCSVNKLYAEDHFNDSLPDLNVKFIMHPKSETSRAIILGCDNEAVYPAGEKFRIIDKEFIEHVVPESNMSCYRLEVHMQEA